jgi:hypothetical protein
MSNPNHYIFRVGNGINFKNSTNPVWGLSKKAKGTKTIVSNIKKGDILWFLKNKSCGGNFIGMAEYVRFFDKDDEPLVKINTFTNEEQNWNGDNLDNLSLQIRYGNLYKTEKQNIEAVIKNQSTIINYETIKNKIKEDLYKHYINYKFYCEPLFPLPPNKNNEYNILSPTMNIINNTESILLINDKDNIVERNKTININYNNTNTSFTINIYPVITIDMSNKERKEIIKKRKEIIERNINCVKFESSKILECKINDNVEENISYIKTLEKINELINDNQFILKNTTMNITEEIVDIENIGNITLSIIRKCAKETLIEIINMIVFNNYTNGINLEIKIQLKDSKKECIIRIL